MSRQLAVSIIVPVFNVQEMLAGCLESIRAQTFSDFEVICVDDGSTDGSGAIAARFAKQDKRFRVIRQENKGPSGARNAGLDAAVGKFVFFVDSDDYIHPQAVEILRDVMRRQAPDIVSARLTATDKPYPIRFKSISLSARDSTVYSPPFEAFLRRVITTNVVMRLYKRTLLKNIRFIEGIHFEDIPFTTMVLSRAKSFADIRLPLYFYYHNPHSIMRSSFTVRKVQSYDTAIRAIDAYIRKNRPEELPKVRACILNQRFKMMVNQALRKQTDPQQRTELFAAIQQVARRLFAEGIISYAGLKPKHRLTLLLMLKCRSPEWARRWAQHSPL